MSSILNEEREKELRKVIIANNKYEYRLKDQIGAGSFGSVYKIIDKDTKEIFALKKIQYRPNADPTNELNILKKLDNEYIVKYKDNYDENCLLCIVIEYCPGGSLRKCIRSKKENKNSFDNELLFKWIKELIFGLHYLHKHNIVHRDIKPENILLTENNKIKIADFGASRVVIDESFTSCGTIEYMSPEMRNLQSHTSSTDIWSAGCVLYELITLNKYYNNSNDSFDALSTKNIFKILLKKMLNQNPDERASAKELKSLMKKCNIVNDTILEKKSEYWNIKRDEKIELKQNFFDKKRFYFGLFIFAIATILLGLGFSYFENTNKTTSTIIEPIISGTILKSLKGGHTDWINALAVLSNNTLASASSDKTIKIWDIMREIVIKNMTGHNDDVWSLVVLQDKTSLASGSGDATIKIWDTLNGINLKTLTGHNDWVRTLAVLSKNHLASGSHDTTVKIWDIVTGSVLQNLTGHNGAVFSLAVLKNNTLASGSADASIKIWDTVKGILLLTLKGHRSWVLSLAVLPNNTLASGSKDETIKVWDVQRGINLKNLTGHNDWVRSLVVLPDKNLASASDDATIKIWDIAKGNVLKILKGHATLVLSLAVLPDNNLASASDDRTIKIWDTAKKTVLMKHQSKIKIGSSVV